jgi:hypothetical protein
VKSFLVSWKEEEEGRHPFYFSISPSMQLTRLAVGKKSH